MIFLFEKNKKIIFKSKINVLANINELEKNNATLISNKDLFFKR